MKILILAALVGILALAPTAAAGTLEAPELTDAAGDCAFAPGNEYEDITAAWVSDETPDAFTVNLALAKWHPELAHATGYTVQFTHQEITWGILAFYDAANGWFYGTGTVDPSTGSVDNYEEATGSFAEGTPAVLSVLFPKGIFPHTNAADNKLTGFYAGTADFKAEYAFFIVPVGPPAPLIQLCDEGQGTLDYAFATGEHANHGPAPANGTAAGAVAQAGNASMDNVSPNAVPAATTGGEKETPGPDFGLFAVAAVGAAIIARRR